MSFLTPFLVYLVYTYYLDSVQAKQECITKCKRLYVGQHVYLLNHSIENYINQYPYRELCNCLSDCGEEGCKIPIQ